MAQRDPIQIRYNPSRSYSNTQNNYVGAQSTAGRRDTLPTFDNANTKHIAATGDDADAGTAAAPYRTVQKAIDNLAGAFVYALITDSATYRERVTITFAAGGAGGLYAADGETPTINYIRGAVAGTFGARTTGRVKFSTGAGATFYYVSKAGNDGTGARGDSGLPFLTFTAALADGARLANDTIQIQDSGVYIENLLVAGTAITIQAADGEVPVIQGVTGVVAMVIDATVSFALYGVTVTRERGDTVNRHILNMIVVGADLDVYDCTFRMTSSANNLSAVRYMGDTTFNVHNCFFDCKVKWGIYVLLGAAGSAPVIDISNSWFTGAANYKIYLDTGQPTAWPGSFDIRQCTFSGTSTQAEVGIVFANTNVAAGTVNIDQCLFEDVSRDQSGTVGVHLSGAIKGASCTVSDCTFKNVGTQAILHDGAGTPTGPLAIYRCVAESCGSRNTSSNAIGSIQIGDAITPTAVLINVTGVIVEDCVVIDAHEDSYQFYPSHGGAATFDFLKNASLNAGRNGVTMYRVGTISAVAIDDFAEKGSGNFSIQGLNVSPAAIVSFSVLEKESTGVTLGDGVVAADPLFLNDSTGQGNVALTSSSPCNQTALLGRDMGPSGATLLLNSTNQDFEINGITLDGEINELDGLFVAKDITDAVVVRYCSLLNMRSIGVAIESDITVEKCWFETTGKGINVVTYQPTINRCVGFKCGGALIVSGGNLVAATNNTAHGCGYGQYDLTPQRFAVQKNNIYSASGQADYRGDNEQTYSCIPVLEGLATVDSNSTRLDPLFRNTASGDLRLQTVEVGYDFNSPAQGLADDSDDAGAFSFTYDTVTLTWTTIDFATSAGDSELAYRNPTTIVRDLIPIKVTQGETNSGDLYSSALAYKRQWTFSWDSSTAFPTAQREDLEQLFTVGDGECQVSFDAGSTWIPCRVVRKTKFQYTEIKGATYSDDSLPMPLKSLILRESA